MQRALQLQPAFEPAPLRPGWRPKLVLFVIWTGIGGGKLRSQNLYDPPLGQALRTVIEGTGCYVGDVQLARGIDEREPPCLRGAAVIVTRQEGKRWPLAYMTTHDGEDPLDFDALQLAFASIGGRP
jgi:hypothetical protein